MINIFGIYSLWVEELFRFLDPKEIVSKISNNDAFF